MDENTSILGRSAPIDTKMMQAVLFIGITIEAAGFAAFPAAFKVLEEQVGVSLQDIAVIQTVEKVVHAFAIIFWGIVGDRVPKFSILTLAAVTWTLVNIWMAFVANYWTLFAIRVVCGVVGGALLPLSAIMIAGSVSRQDRGKYFGIGLFCGQLGAIIGQTCLITIQHIVGPFEMQGWRMCFLFYALLSAAFTVWAAGFALSDEEPPLNKGSILLSSTSADVMKILRIPTVCFTLLQAIFRNTAVQILSFSVMWIQYQGFDDQTAAWINNARLVGWMLGSLVAGVVADNLAKAHGDWSRIAFGQVGDVLRIVFALVAFGLVPAMFGSNVVSMGGQIMLVIALFMEGLAQPWAYIGMMRPFLADVVTPQHWGLCASVVGIVENIISSLVAGPAVAMTAAAFGYVDVGSADASPSIAASNGAALGKCILWTTTICQVTMCAILGLLYQNYEKDRANAECDKLADLK